jgi:glycosyltransferase involved in cell wall biosynthesis
MDKKPYVVVFMPALNEQEMIGKVIRRIGELYAESEGYRVETIVVDDGSTDETEQEARKTGVQKVIKHPFNLGLGAATRSGMEAALEMGADIAVKIDADFQHDPEDIDKVIRPILNGRADVVFGSRFLGQIKYKMPLGRRLGNAMFTFLVNRLTRLHITDAQTGLMAFSSKYLRRFNIISDYNETQQLILDASNKHMRVMEVPVVFHPRTTGRSFISVKYPIKVLPTILRLLVQGAPLKVFVPVGTFFILLGIVATIAVIQGFAPVFIGDAAISILVIGGLLIIMFGLLADTLAKSR